jgi:hypothetical protein
MNSESSFIKNLLNAVPELSGTLDEHLAANDSLLPHVFMGDVTRFYLSEVEKSVENDVVLRLLSILEEGLNSGDEKVDELISVSFIENLGGEDTVIESSKHLMGPALRRTLRTVLGIP